MKKTIKKILSFVNKADEVLGDQRMRRRPARSLHNILWEKAAARSADFVEKELGNCLIFENKGNELLVAF